MDRDAVEPTAETGSMQLCSFWLAGRLFGIDILDVKEVTDEVGITPIAHAPGAVRGYVNIRGQIHLVIDLRTLFGFGPREDERHGKAILFKHHVDEPFGVLVDDVADVVAVERERIEERRSKGGGGAGEERRRASAELSRGVCKLDERLLVVLNAGAILGAATGVEEGINQE
jgi:purine-binding chemotaxis protein CheW